MTRKLPVILVVEDDEGWRELLSSWLEGKGCAVVLSSDGAGTLPLARRHRPDCVILDYDLGDMTGLEVCNLLKTAPGLENTPVVIQTMMAGEMLKIVSGCRPDHFVVKSQSPDELFAVLEGLLPGFTAGFAP